MKVMLPHKTTVAPQQLRGGGAAHCARVSKSLGIPHCLYGNHSGAGGWQASLLPSKDENLPPTQPSMTPSWQWGSGTVLQPGEGRILGCSLDLLWQGVVGPHFFPCGICLW